MPCTATKSYEYIDVEQIVDDLLCGVDVSAKKNKVGFLVCSFYLDCEKLIAKLQSSVGFIIVGGTTIGDPVDETLFVEENNDISVRLMVFETEKLEVGIGVTKGNLLGNEKAKIKEMYSECIKGVSQKPKMFFLCMATQVMHRTYEIIEEIFTNAGDVPVFGGIYSTDLQRPSLVFASGQAYDDKVVMLALAGDIEPVFSVGCRVAAPAAYEPTVTQASENIVYKVDDMTFCDYLNSVGFTLDREKGSMTASVMEKYAMLPILINHENKKDDEITTAYVINEMNLEEGSARFGGKVPEGTKISVGALRRKDVMSSAAECTDELQSKMQAVKKEQGYEHSLVFVMDCIARYSTMTGRQNIESEVLRENMPKNLNVFGYYSFGEFGPVVKKEGLGENRRYTQSIFMCAI